VTKKQTKSIDKFCPFKKKFKLYEEIGMKKICNSKKQEKTTKS